METKGLESFVRRMRAARNAVFYAILGAFAGLGSIAFAANPLTTDF